MISIEQFTKDNKINKPLLFLGKGPSFSMRHEFVLSDYFTLACNHTIREMNADMCSVIDIDVLTDCADEIYNNCNYLLIPWHPHDPEVGYGASEKDLYDFAEEIPTLKKMINENRVVFYNLASSEDKHDDSRVYATAINSADTLFNMLVANGIDTVYSLGVDGGKSYSKEFSDITPLRNGRQSFDEQNPVIDAICAGSGAKFIRLQDSIES